MASSVVIKRVVAIECDDGMPDWTVKHLEVIEGREYVKLSCGCTGFQRFVGGKLYRSEMKVAQMPFLKDLAHLRTQATLSAMIASDDTPQPMFDEVAPMTPAAKKKARLDARLGLKVGTLPPIVSIELPAFDTASGEHIDAITVRVQASVDARAEILLELDGRMLYYLKQAMRASVKERVVERKRADGARWRSDRKCWTSRRQQDGDRKYKTFRPSDPCDPVSVQEAAVKAVAWAEGLDDDSVSEAAAPIQDGVDEPCDGADEPIQDDDSEPSAAALETTPLGLDR